MHMPSIKFSIFCFAACAAAAAELPPGVPEAISYQGVLRVGKDSTPVPAGVYSTNVRIYDTARAGTALWGRRQTVKVTGEKGFFNVVLKDAPADSDDALPGLTNSLKQVFAAVGSANRWISFSVGGKELLPRQQFTTTPLAVSAANAYGAAGDFTLTGNLSVGRHWDGTPDSGGTHARELMLTNGLRVVKNFETLEGSNSVLRAHDGFEGRTDLVARGPAEFSGEILLNGDAVFLSEVQAGHFSASNLVVRQAFAPRETQCLTALQCYYAANYPRSIWNPDDGKNEKVDLYADTESREYWMHADRRRTRMVSNTEAGEEFNAECWEENGLRFGPYAGDSFLIFCFYIGTHAVDGEYYDGIVEFTTTYVTDESTVQTIRCGNDPGLFKTISIPVPADATLTVRYIFDTDKDASNTTKHGHIDISSVWWVGFGGEDTSRYAAGGDSLLPPALPPKAKVYTEEELSPVSVSYPNPGATNTIFAVYDENRETERTVSDHFTFQTLMCDDSGAPIASDRVLLSGKLVRGEETLWQTSDLLVETNPQGLANIQLEAPELVSALQHVTAAEPAPVLGGNTLIWRAMEIKGVPAAGSPEIRQELTTAPYAFTAEYAPAALTDFTVAGDMEVSGFAALGGLNATVSGVINGEVMVEGGVQTKGELEIQGSTFTLDGRAWFGDGLTATNAPVTVNGHVQSTDALKAVTLEPDAKSLLLLEDGGAASFWTASGAFASSPDEGGWFEIDRQEMTAGKVLDCDGFLLAYAYAAGRKQNALTLTSPTGDKPICLYFSNLHKDADTSNANLLPVPKGWKVTLTKTEGDETEYTFLWLPLKRR